MKQILVALVLGLLVAVASAGASSSYSKTYILVEQSPVFLPS